MTVRSVPADPHHHEVGNFNFQTDYEGSRVWRLTIDKRFYQPVAWPWRDGTIVQCDTCDKYFQCRRSLIFGDMSSRMFPIRRRRAERIIKRQSRE